MRAKLRSIIGYLLLFLFIGYYSSITLFWHAHRIGNEVITHSHPFNTADHSHTTAQFALIKMLSTTVGLLTLAGFILAKLYSGKKQIAIARDNSFTHQQYDLTYFRRGPPAYLFA